MHPSNVGRGAGGLAGARRPASMAPTGAPIWRPPMWLPHISSPLPMPLFCPLPPPRFRCRAPTRLPRYAQPTRLPRYARCAHSQTGRTPSPPQRPGNRTCRRPFRVKATQLPGSCCGWAGAASSGKYSLPLYRTTSAVRGKCSCRQMQLSLLVLVPHHVCSTRANTAAPVGRRQLGEGWGPGACLPGRGWPLVHASTAPTAVMAGRRCQQPLPTWGVQTSTPKTSTKHPPTCSTNQADAGNHGRHPRPTCGPLLKGPAAFGQVQQAAHHVSLAKRLPIVAPPPLVHLRGVGQRMGRAGGGGWRECISL